LVAADRYESANAFLGVNQGLAWSMTVVMKIDLVGPKRRGLALGLNEAAGYGGVALAAGLSGWLAADLAARDVLVVAGAVIAVLAFLCSVLFVRDTAAHVALQTAGYSAATRPMSATLAPCAARKSGTSPQASASLRLLTRPACEHERSVGSR
jgi:MFS family permease